MNSNTGEIRSFPVGDPIPADHVRVTPSEVEQLLKLKPEARMAALKAMRRPARRHLQRQLAKRGVSS
jgi:hypothetical protein